MFNRKTRIRPVDDATSYILSSKDKPWFMERFIDSYKGRGVFTTQPIEAGAFVLEYRGELISMEECQSRHYSEIQSTFLYEFEWQKRQWCIDASREDGSLGRLANDNHKSPNCIMKKVMVNDRPHLCLFAVKNIGVGTEIDYNYGDSKWPWRKKVTKKQVSAVTVDTKTSLIDSSSQEDPNSGDADTQVTKEQVSAVTIDTETSLIHPSSQEDPNSGDADTQVTKEQVSAVTIDTEMSLIHPSSQEDPNSGDADTQVTKEQVSAVTIDTETSLIHPSSPEDPNSGDADTQVTKEQVSAVTIDTETSLIHPSSQEDPNSGDADTQVTKEQVSAVTIDTETSLIHPSSQEDPNSGDADTQVTKEQVSAVTIDTETSLIHPSSQEDPNSGDADTQVTKEQVSAVTIDTETSLIHPSSQEDPNSGDADTQVTKEQVSAVTIDTETSLIHPSSQEDPNSGDADTQVFSLVDYSDSDENHEDCISQPLTPPCDAVVQKLCTAGNILMGVVPDFSDALSDSSDGTDDSSTSKTEMASQLPRRRCCLPMDRVPDFDDTLYDSDETMVKETDVDSVIADSSMQSDHEVVPKLRRTKSILMDRVRDFSDVLYDRSDDDTEGPSTCKSEMASQRPRRKWCRPIQISPAESDVSSVDSEEEYMPDPKEESTDSECSLELSLEKNKKDKISSTSLNRSKSSSLNNFKSSKQKIKSSSQSQVESSRSRSTETSHDSIQRSPDSRGVVNEVTHSHKETSVSECLKNEVSVIVDPVLKKEDGSRKYNKKHHCFYCGQVVQKMSRHLLRKHDDITDVAKAFSLPKNSKERRLQLDYIRNKGNFEHNTEVLESKKGKLIPWKQPREKKEGQVFMHCVYCYGLFTRRAMWRHFKYCKFKPQSSKPGKTRVQALCAFAETAPTGFCDAYWKFLNEMNQDAIAVVIKQDRCILEYGYRLFKKNERVISQHQYIRQKLRELGRLVVAAKKVTPVKTIKELIKPDKYGHVVTAAKCLAGLSDETGKYQCPSLARKVGHSLFALAMFLKSEGLKMKDKQTTQDAEEFAQLYQESWKFDIASQALTQLNQAKWNSPQLLPFTQDVQNLHAYLSEKQQEHLNALKEEASPLNWKDLAKVTLAQVILFNRRREGEVSRMLLSVYLSRDESETHEDVNLALTPLEQKLCKHFVRITIVGKRGRKVPVLLTPLMKESVDALNAKREECGVLNENGFLFALPQSVHYLRGCDCIRQFVNECDNIKNPKALTSTKLRKHIATLSTVLNLKTTELDQLADFLGHNIDVHRKHYRLPEGTLQLAKISKVLLALEQGRLSEYKGKSLDEIHIDVNDTVETEGCSQEAMEDVRMPETQDSEEEDETSLQECTSTVSAQNQRKSAKKRDASMCETQGREEDSETSLQECASTMSALKSAKKRGKRSAAAKRSWTPEECCAVERHLQKFIVRGQVPGKMDCEHCITAEPQALKDRDWKAVKYFIKNRITTLRRKVQ